MPPEAEWDEEEDEVQEYDIWDDIDEDRAAQLAKAPAQPRRMADWKRSWLDEEDDDLADLWGPEQARGSGAWGSWLGGYKRKPGADLAIELNDAMKFARTMAGMSARKKLKGIAWATVGVGGCANLATKQVTLDPGPVRKILDRSYTTDEAHNVIGGIALHEGSHLANTPRDQMERYGKLRPAQQVGLTYGALIEDPYVEARVLAEYPGYESYFDDAWQHFHDDEATHQAILECHADWNKTSATVLVQDLSRRYRPLTPEHRAALEALPEDSQRFLAAAGRLTDAARSPKLKPDQRVQLAEALIRLFEEGDPEPQGEGEEPKGGGGPPGDQPGRPIPAPGGDLEEAAEALKGEGTVPKDTDGATEEGQAVNGLDSKEATEAEAEAGREREYETQVWPTGDGVVEARVVWTTEKLEPRDKKRYREELREVQPHIPPLAKALALRANKPHRQLTAQTAGRLDGGRLVAAILPGAQPRAFRRTEILSAPRVGVTILQDISGSMAGSRIEACRRAVTLLERGIAAANTEGGDIALLIRAHTTTHELNKATGRHEELCWITRICDPRHPDPARIGTLDADSNNLDGLALRAILKEAERAWPDRQRLCLYLNDGLPAGLGYGGATANEQVQQVVAAARRKGTEVVTIFLGRVDNYHHRPNLEQMYGREGRGWFNAPTPAQLPAIVAKIARARLAWQA